MTVKSSSKAISRSASLKHSFSPPSKKARGRGAKETSPFVTSLAHHRTLDRAPYTTARDYVSSSLSGVRPSREVSSLNRHNSIEFRVIFSVAFGLFLLTSVLERALPHKWSNRTDAGEIRKSVVEQAKEAAHISVGYAFMG